MKRHIKRFIITLTLVVMMGVSVLAVTAMFSGGTLLSVQSGSMVPAFNKGDLVSVKHVRADSLRPGDVITFTSPRDKRSTVTHRIVRIIGSGKEVKKFITKGDANKAPDAAVDASQIIGKVGFSIPLVGSGIDFIRTPIGLILAIYIPALWVITSELKRLATYYQSLKPYVIAGRQSKLLAYKYGGVSAVRILSILLLLPLFFTIKAYSALQSTATISGSTISGTIIALPNDCNSTTVTTTGNGSGNLSISNNSNQYAQTGNATNCNNVNIHVNITNR